MDSLLNVIHKNNKIWFDIEHRFSKILGVKDNCNPSSCTHQNIPQDTVRYHLNQSSVESFVFHQLEINVPLDITALGKGNCYLNMKRTTAVEMNELLQFKAMIG